VRSEKSGGRIDPTTVPTFELQQLDSAPAARFRSAPTYPMEMRQAGLGGEVLVEFVVDANGEIQNVHAMKSTRPEFEPAAVNAVGQWGFKPVPMVFRTGESGSPGNPSTDPVFPTEYGLQAFWVTADPPKPGEKPFVPPSWF
jgi:TonB family protein